MALIAGAELVSYSQDGRDLVSSFRSPHVPGLELSRKLHAGPLPGLSLLPYVHIRMQLAGEEELRWGRDQWRERPGGCIVVAPHYSPRVVRRLSEAATTLHAYISPRVFDEWARQHAGSDSRSFKVGHLEDAELASALQTLAAQVATNAGASLVRASFEALMCEVQRALALPGAQLPGGARRPEVNKMRELLRERMAEPVSLDELAAHAGLSKFHVLRLFRAETGLPPHEFQLQLRISHARALLAEDVPAAEVAATCGFADQAHFTRCFKRITGATPGAFRRLVA